MVGYVREKSDPYMSPERRGRSRKHAHAQQIVQGPLSAAVLDYMGMKVCCGMPLGCCSEVCTGVAMLYASVDGAGCPCVFLSTPSVITGRGGIRGHLSRQFVDFHGVRNAWRARVSRLPSVRAPRLSAHMRAPITMEVHSELHFAGTRSAGTAPWARAPRASAASRGAPCSEQYSVPDRADVWQPEKMHLLPPPCAMHKSVRSRADRLHPGCLHRRPPPCALHRGSWPCAALLHPSWVHRLPPPCAMHSLSLPIAPFVQPGCTQVLLGPARLLLLTGPPLLAGPQLHDNGGSAIITSSTPL